MITKHCWLGASTTDIYLLRALEAESQRSGCQQGQFLWWPLPLAGRPLPSPCVLTDVPSVGVSVLASSSCKDISHFGLAVVQSLSHVQLFVTPWAADCQPRLSFIISQSLFRFMSIESMMSSNHLILCRHLLLLPSTFPSIRVFSNELDLHIRWPKYWSVSFSISPSNEYSGLISFRIDWFDLLAVQGTLKSLLQHCSSKASILQCLAWIRTSTYELEWDMIQLAS